MKKKVQNDAFYSISGAIRTGNLVKFYQVLIILFFCPVKLYILMKNKHPIQFSGGFETINDLISKHNYQMIKSEVRDV